MPRHTKSCFARMCQEKMHEFWDKPNRWLAVVIMSSPVRLGKTVDSKSTSITVATIEQNAASGVPTSEAVNSMGTMQSVNAAEGPILDKNTGQRDMTRGRIRRIVSGRHPHCLKCNIMLRENSRKTPEFGLEGRHSTREMPEQVFDTRVVFEKNNMPAMQQCQICLDTKTRTQ